MTTKPLWEETRDLHHACEQHLIGRAMSLGNPPRAWYAEWLVALRQIHSAVDAHAPAVVGRVDRLTQDIEAMGMETQPLAAAEAYVQTLCDRNAIDGAVYVLTGAHLMGGEIMRRRLERFPTNHLEWDDRKEALAVLQTYRTRDDITQQARDCFQALLNVMDEIKDRYTF